MPDSLPTPWWLTPVGGSALSGRLNGGVRIVDEPLDDVGGILNEQIDFRALGPGEWF